MITNSKASAPFVPTDKLEILARELFNGALPKLPADGMKRRSALAKEFADAHLNVPGVAKRDAQKFAAIGTPLQAIAASRQARVDAFLAALPQPITERALRDKLVIALGEQALQVKLMSAHNAVACALTLLDALERKDAKLDLLTNHIADGGKAFLAKLDAAFGAGASAKILPQGPLRLGAMSELLDGLADALADSRAGMTFAATPSKPTIPPQATASTSKLFKTAPPAASCKPAVAAPTRKTRTDFDQLSARAKMDFIKAGGKLAD